MFVRTQLPFKKKIKVEWLYIENYVINFSLINSVYRPLKRKIKFYIAEKKLIYKNGEGTKFYFNIIKQDKLIKEKRIKERRIIKSLEYADRYKKGEF